MNDFLTPHAADLDEAQRRWLEDQVPPEARVLDLGCGGGRTLIPLVRRGVRCTGVDLDARALMHCEHRLRDAGLDATLHHGDFRRMVADSREFWDVVLCLGNTWCLIWEIEEAITVLTAIRHRLRPGGRVVIDDIPGDLWPEVANGHWQEGLDSESGTQLVWAEDDAIFALRSAERADPDNWTLGPDDERLRLWTSASLDLVARVAGFAVPVVRKESGVRILTPAQPTEIHAPRAGG